MRVIVGILFVLATIAGLIFVEDQTKIFSSLQYRFFPPSIEVPIPTTTFSAPTDAPFVHLAQTKESIIQIPKTAFTQHHVILFSYTIKNKAIRFFIIKEGIRDKAKYRAVLDACRICYAQQLGFDYNKKYFTCRDCSMEFHMERVGIATGGCNPIKLPIIVDENNIYIPMENLTKAANLF